MEYFEWIMNRDSHLYRHMQAKLYNHGFRKPETYFQPVNS